MRKFYRPCLEEYEKRLVPASFSWEGNGGWHDDTHWNKDSTGTGQGVPGTGDTAVFGTAAGQCTVDSTYSAACKHLVLSAAYTSWLKVNGVLNVWNENGPTGSSGLSGGTIKTDTTTSSVNFIGGTTDWLGTVLNPSGNSAMNFYICNDGTFNANVGATTVGANFWVGYDIGPTVSTGTLTFRIGLTQSVSFVNNTGINISGGGQMNLEQGTNKNVGTTGTGVIDNKGWIVRGGALADTDNQLSFKVNTHGSGGLFWMTEGSLLTVDAPGTTTEMEFYDGGYIEFGNSSTLKMNAANDGILKIRDGGELTTGGLGAGLLCGNLEVSESVITIGKSNGNPFAFGITKDLTITDSVVVWNGFNNGGNLDLSYIDIDGEMFVDTVLYFIQLPTGTAELDYLDFFIKLDGDYTADTVTLEVWLGTTEVTADSEASWDSIFLYLSLLLA